MEKKNMSQCFHLHQLLVLFMKHILPFLSLLTSHPVNLAYLIFFLPYIFTLISFLFPLILSTSLLLLSLLDAGDNSAGVTDHLTSMLFTGSPPQTFLGNESELPEAVDFLSLPSVDEEDCHEKPEFLAPNSPTQFQITTSQAKNFSKDSNLGAESLQREWSMRKARDWKRTPACKLFEERMTYKICEDWAVTKGSEEMDLLWEAFEANDKAIKDNKRKKEKKEKQLREEEDEFEEKKVDTGELCCLQVLRLSSGKLKRRLLKFSKIVKGMGLLQRPGSRRSRKS